MLAILKLSIIKPDNNFLIFDFIIWELQRLKPYKIEDAMTRKWRVLSVAELNCVLGWLEFIFPYKAEEGMNDNVQEAIENVAKMKSSLSRLVST